MPRAAPEPAPQLQPELALKPEHMDIPDMAAEHEMAFEPQREAYEQPEEYKEEQLEEDEECITLRSVTLPGHSHGHTIPDQGRTISFCRFAKRCSSGQTRGPGDVPSHHGQIASSSRTSCTTTSPVTSL
jgi:hypothetical protein